MGKTFHPECFVCAYCGKIFANSPFYIEYGLPYCEEGKIPPSPSPECLNYALGLVANTSKDA